MSGNFVPLSEVVRQHNYQAYDETLPMPLQWLARWGVWFTFGTELVLLAIFILFPHNIWLVHLESGGFFVFQPSVQLANSLFYAVYTILPVLILLNLLSLFLSLIVMSVTWWLTQPTRLQTHYLATANLIPTGVSLGIAGLMIGSVIVAIAVNLIAWVVIIFIVLMVVFVALGVLAAL